MPLVLVHNEVKANPAHNWDDVEGVQYHYPSKYKGLIKPGTSFVYYRGVHRLDGRRRPSGEYFGAGRIGDIRPDPDKPRAWYCAIEDYTPFGSPVPAKINGAPREDIPRNMWRDGVRLLDQDVFAQILSEAETANVLPYSIYESAQKDAVADILIVPPRQAQGLQIPRTLRRSKQSKRIGDKAEAIALDYIRDHLAGPAGCVHRAALGETPGWDIDYVDRAGSLQRVEVKGTVGGAFVGIEITANELRAAKTHGPTFWLCLVAGCESADPKLQMIQDPYAKLAEGFWSAKPTMYALRFAPRPDS